MIKKTTNIVNTLKITTLIFDLNRTLVDFRRDKATDKLYQKEFGVDRKIFWSNTKKYYDKYGTGRAGIDYYIGGAIKNLHLEKRYLVRAKIIHEESFYVIKGIPELLKKLKKNYNILLFAGDGRESINFKIDNFGLRKYFDEIYTTCDEHVLKTDIRIYKRMIKKSSLNPKQCILIDDLEHHLMLAREVNINTILFKNSKQLKKDLKRFGVNA